MGGKPVLTRDLPLPTHSEAIAAVIDKLTSAEYGVVSSMHEIDAVGHRVVHGGEKFASSVFITDEVMKGAGGLHPLRPAAQPANITGINACIDVMGKDVPQVASSTPLSTRPCRQAYMYAPAVRLLHQDGVRRYGFHGTSHRYVSQRCAELMGKPIEELKLISCHMGNGSSICAIMNGKSVDTSMGFTPLVGLPMGTRWATLTRAPCSHHEQVRLDIDAMLTILNKKSGVLGVSGVSSDFRDLEAAAEEGNEPRPLALDMFDYSVAKVVGSYVAAMNGVDAIIFTAGVGENAPTTRAGICQYLGYLGCEIDEAANARRGSDNRISTDSSRVQLWVIPTNEELVIARDTRDIVSAL